MPRSLKKFSWCVSILLVLLKLTEAISTDVSKIPFNPPQHWRNVNILRTLDLTSSIVRETTAIVALNVADESFGEYYLPIEELFNEHLAWIEAKERKTDRVFDVEKAEFDSLNKIQFYKIIFNRRIDPQEKITFVIKTAFTHILKPIPHEITQTGRQYLFYSGNQYSNNAYFSEKQKTNVKLAYSTLMSYSQGDKVLRNGKVITYGFFYNLAPNSFEKLEVHYGFQKAILTVTNLRRDLEVSHWGGNLAIEEHFNLKHDGAKLKGQFSRLEFQTSSVYGHLETTMARDLSLLLPPRASDVYYRDEVGNVSTSKFRNDRDNSVLEFKPRYPLFGGWNYTWNHGYNVPLYDFVHYHSGRFILNVPFISGFPQTTYEKVEVRVVLPEGAKDVKVETPFTIDRESHGIHKTYLDTSGRYLVVLEKNNVVDEHVELFQISYRYDNYEFLRKPLAVSTVFFAGFLFSIIYSRMEFKIGVKP
ncbi:hypothetical protein G9A89_011747 [Geosiphon pyriformis]|nr:hypothetical protein G9A89_011747 [Geosiphon pyriformis]